MDLSSIGRNLSEEIAETGKNMIERALPLPKEILMKPYPLNLILAILRGWEYTPEITDDIAAGVECALASLTEKEQRVMQYRYMERKSYAAIGRTLGVTGSGIAHLHNNAVRKLKQPKNLGLILYGKDGFAAMHYQFHYPWREAPKQADPHDPDIMVLSFEELDFSIRTFNCLRRSGYEFVRDIFDLTPEQILKIRNLNVKNREEIALKIRGLGLLGTHWDDYIH